jgi:elongation factor P--(R)-beta-lysine ligase
MPNSLAPNLNALHQRQTLNRTIRHYFERAGVLEVETPILSEAGNTDPAIQSFLTHDAATDGRALWLRTSPEFFHKRLLASGSGDIFEIAKVFRQGEHSSRHRREFTMLEYYRLGFDEFALMDDLAALIHALSQAFGLQPLPVRRLRYQDWFIAELGIDPLTAPLSELQARTQALGVMGAHSRDDCLDLLRTHVLEARLAPACLTFVYDFPASQAALARLNADAQTARRFELFAGGFELANGYFELTDPTEQARRFRADIATRQQRGLPEVAMDHGLIAALQLGLPECAGVAVGLDRLLLVLTGQRDLQALELFA